MKNILLCIDFNEKTEILMDKAFEFFQPFEAKIWLLHAAAPHPDFVGYEVGPQYIRDARANELRQEHKMLNQFAERLKLKGIAADGLLIQGATPEVILEESKKLNIDLIVMGHQEHNFMYNIFFGSNAAAIVKKSNIPVLVIPLG